MTETTTTETTTKLVTHDGKEETFLVFRAKKEAELFDRGLANLDTPEKERKVYNNLIRSVAPAAVERIVEMNTRVADGDKYKGSKVIDLLNDMYMSGSSAHVDTLRTKLYAPFKMEEGEKVEQYITKLLLLVMRLRAAGGDDITDDQQKSAILRGLPPSWRDVKKHQLFADKSIAELRKILVAHEEQMEQELKEHGGQDDAFKATHLNGRGADRGAGRGRGRGRGFTPRRGRGEKNPSGRPWMDAKEGKCFNCGKPGHTKKECWSKGGGQYKEKGEQKEKKGDSARVAEIGKDAIVFMAEYLSDHEEAQMQECDSSEEEGNTGTAIEFIADNGATRHMCNDKGAFSNYVEAKAGEHTVQGAFVTQGSTDTSQQVLGIGDVFMWKEDKDGTMHRMKLVNVLHVPTLSRNLLSLTTMKERGHGFSSPPGDKHLDLISRTGITMRLPMEGKQYVFKATLEKEPTDAARLASMEKKLDELCKTVATARIATHVHKVKNTPRKAALCTAVLVTTALAVGANDLWHKRMGHVGEKALNRTHGAVDGMGYDPGGGHTFCDSCAVSKSHRAAIPKKADPAKKATRKLEVVHTDLQGPMPVGALQTRNKYLVLFKDEYTGAAAIYGMQHKSQALDKLKQFIADVGGVPENMCIQADNDGVYTSHAWREYCREKGIRLQFSSPYTPQQNGIAERYWRTLNESAESMLQGAGLPKQYWERAYKTANYLQNRIVHTGYKETPLELMTGKVPDLTHLRVFGCKGFVHVPKELRRKLDAKALEGVHVGYSEQHKAYVTWVPSKHKFVVTRNVQHNEQDFPAKHSTQRDQTADSRIPDGMETTTVRTGGGINPHGHSPDINTPPGDDDPTHTARGMTLGSLRTHGEEFGAGIARPDPTITQHDGRVLRSNVQAIDMANATWHELDEVEFAFLTEHVEGGDTYEYDHEGKTPKSHKEAMQGEDAHHWRAAEQVEYDTLTQNKTWSLQPLPTGRKPVTGKWTYKIKRNKDGSVEKYKARYVARGFTQVWGDSYTETFSPVVRFSAVRLLIAVAAYMGATLWHYDVRGAFLQSDALHEEIYMTQPEGFEQLGPNGDTLYCKLRVPLYGLKQASRQFNKTLDKWLKDQGFTPHPSEPCLYTLIDGDGRLVAGIACYVDDLVYLSTDTKQREEFAKRFSERFEITNLGELDWFLGIGITQKDGSISINQPKYVRDILNRFNMTNCKEAQTPMVEDSKLKHTGDEGVIQDPHLRSQYRSMVGMLMYLCVATRPDITYAVGVLSRHLDKPTPTLMSAAKRVIRYLKGTMEFGITYYHKDNGGNVHGIEDAFYGLADADWAGDLGTRKSTSGHCTLFNGGAVTWRSKLQTVVAKSTSEAEYICTSGAGSEITYIRGLLKHLGHDTGGPTTLLEDNQGCIALAEDALTSTRAKHIDIHFHYIRELVNKRLVTLKYIPTQEMTADTLTKPLGPQKFRGHTNTLLNRWREHATAAGG